MSVRSFNFFLLSFTLSVSFRCLFQYVFLSSPPFFCSSQSLLRKSICLMVQVMSLRCNSSKAKSFIIHARIFFDIFIVRHMNQKVKKDSIDFLVPVFLVCYLCLILFLIFWMFATFFRLPKLFVVSTQ